MNKRALDGIMNRREGAKSCRHARPGIVRFLASKHAVAAAALSDGSVEELRYSTPLTSLPRTAATLRAWWELPLRESCARKKRTINSLPLSFSLSKKKMMD